MSIPKINTAAIIVENANVKLGNEFLEDSLNYLLEELELQTKIYPPSDQHSSGPKSRGRNGLCSHSALHQLWLVEVLFNNQEAALDNFKTEEQIAQTKKDLLEEPSKLEKFTSLIHSRFVYAEVS